MMSSSSTSAKKIDRTAAIISGLASLVLLLCVAGAAHGLWEGWERLIVALYGEKPV